MMRWLLGIGVVVAVLGGVVTAQADYYDGLRAADAGRHSDALREWQAAANAGRRQGDAGAGAPLRAGPGCTAGLRASAYVVQPGGQPGGSGGGHGAGRIGWHAWRPNRWPRRKNKRRPGSRNPPRRRLRQRMPGRPARPRRKPFGRRRNSWRPWAMSRTRTGNGASARPKPIRRSYGTRTCRRRIP